MGGTALVPTLCAGGGGEGVSVVGGEGTDCSGWTGVCEEVREIFQEGSRDQGGGISYGKKADSRPRLGLG